MEIDGRTIANNFLGQGLVRPLESYSDYANRLPRGRTYVRNGSVVHLEIEPGKLTAIVSGSEIYHVNIAIKPLNSAALARYQDPLRRPGQLRAGIAAGTFG